MFRKLFVLSIILILAFVSSSPAQAISYGVPDGTDHPNVGAFVIMGEDYGFLVCSGTLIAPKVFLTASHCTVYADWFLSANPDAGVFVTFDQTVRLSATFYHGTQVTNPNYNPNVGEHDASDPGDVAVILLDEAPLGITPAQLPTAGVLDELKAQHLLNDTLFTAVGYGTVRETNKKAWQAFEENLDRNQVDQEFLSLTKAWLTNSMNLATGNGGTCYGDSGGPHFIHLDGMETNIVVSVTVTGDRYCKATDKTYRVDTESARSFLADYVTLP